MMRFITLNILTLFLQIIEINIAIADDGVFINTLEGRVFLKYEDIPKEDEDRVFNGASILKTNGPSHSTSIFEALSLYPDSYHFPTIRHKHKHVKHQGDRGTCTAFAAVALFEQSNERFSEQCLIKFSSDSDPGYLPERVYWIIDNYLYLENDCKDHYGALQKDIIPLDLSSKQKFKFTGKLHSVNPSDLDDPIQFIREMINKQLPVAVTVYVVGNWWANSAWVPWGPPSYIRFREKNRITSFSSKLSFFNVVQSWYDKSLQNFLMNDFLTGNGPGLTFGIHYIENGQTKSYKMPEDRNKYFSHLGPLEVPSDSEIKETCKEDPSTVDKSFETKRCAGHAIVITGYDDRHHVLQFKNSWGYRWKHDGFGYMSYDYFRRFYKSIKMLSYDPHNY